VSVHLLDVNVLIALMWPAHEGHARAQRWLAEESQGGWATCPLVQAALVRIISDPAFSRDAVSPSQAIKILQSAIQHRLHQFWPDDLGVIEALQTGGKKLIGHQQVTDAYLLGLAAHRKGKLLTFDRSAMALLPHNGQSSVTILR
jgi:uncharacterized protein